MSNTKTAKVSQVGVDLYDVEFLDARGRVVSRVGDVCAEELVRMGVAS